MHSSKISLLLKCIVRRCTPEGGDPWHSEYKRVKLHLMWMQCQCMRESMTALIFSPISAAKHPAKELDLSMNSVTSDCLRQLVVWAADPSHGKEHKDRGGNASKHLGTICAGQIIATSHDLTQKGKWWRESPLFQESQRLLKYMWYIYRYFSVACNLQNLSAHVHLYLRPTYILIHILMILKRYYIYYIYFIYIYIYITY